LRNLEPLLLAPYAFTVEPAISCLATFNKLSAFKWSKISSWASVNFSSTLTRKRARVVIGITMFPMEDK
ncbi:MAG: hypothetical protein LC138_06985, partial [Anaerolineales bacterium]|nr:hypothetical protein [Anaerolineales bacterium]